MEKKNVVIQGCSSNKSELSAGCDQHSLENKRHYFLTIENQKQHLNARTIEPLQKRPLTATDRLKRFQRLRDKNLKLAGQEVAVGRRTRERKMALEIETMAAVDHNGTDGEQVEERTEDNITLNEQIHQKLGKLNSNGMEPIVVINGQSTLENGHSITDSPKSRGKRSIKRSVKSTPTKSKKLTAKSIAENNAADDDNKSENSSSIFSKDTEDDSSVVAVTDDYDASAEFVDISLALTPEPDDEEIDVEDICESNRDNEEKEGDKTPTVVPETTILSSLRERIRFSLSPKKREPKVEEKEVPVASEKNSIYKGISARRPLRSPQSSYSEENKPVYKQTEALGEDACLKRKADQDSYSFQSKKIRKDSTGWNFYPFKWFTSPKNAECSLPKSTPRKLHDEIEEMVIDEVATEVSPVKQAGEVESAATEEQKKTMEGTTTEKQQAEKTVDETNKIESTQDESVASSKSDKTWSCSVM